VDLVLDLLGGATAVDTVERRVDDRLALGVHLRAADGALGSVIVATGARSFHFRLEVVTDLGVVLTSTDLADVLLRPADGGGLGPTVRWSASPLDRGHKRSGYYGELAGFCSAARSRTAFTPGLPDLIPTYEVLSQIRAKGQP
jgi:hypothetical protein